MSIEEILALALLALAAIAVSIYLDDEKDPDRHVSLLWRPRRRGWGRWPDKPMQIVFWWVAFPWFEIRVYTRRKQS